MHTYMAPSPPLSPSLQALPSNLGQTALADSGVRLAGGGRLCVKRKRVIGEEYHILGTFRLQATGNENRTYTETGVSI